MAARIIGIIVLPNEESILAIGAILDYKVGFKRVRFKLIWKSVYLQHELRATKCLLSPACGREAGREGREVLTILCGELL